MDNLVDFAQNELDKLIDSCEEEDGKKLQKVINEGILEVIKTFALQHHSGFTGEYALHIIEKLLRFKPLTELTGEEDEWNEVEENIWQNKRCFNVFKDEEGNAWINSSDGKKEIEFPYNLEIGD